MPHDDACLSMLAFLPPSRLEITSEASCCRTGRAFAEGWAKLAGMSDVERGQIVLALDEAVTNIIRHGYQNAAGHRIEIQASFQENALEYRLRDWAPVADPAAFKGRDLADLRPGGLGLALLRMTFQEVRWEARPDGNDLILRKRLGSGS
jgi:anti-sigma regulatory factor (Ser/Thr protein kinase)